MATCYAIGAMGSEDLVLAIKIGITARPVRQRLRSLQTGSPFPLVLLGTRRFAGWSAAVEFETWVHRQFAHHALSGEWLRPAPVVESMIRRSFTEQFKLNWIDAHCGRAGHEDCECRAPQWRCA